MHALPAGFRVASILDLTHNDRMLLLLNVVGLGLFFIFSAMFTVILFRLRPFEAQTALTIGINSLADGVRICVWFLLVNVAMVFLHEGAHGLCFAFFTRSRPVFGFRWYLAFASAPGWYLPRGQYLITALAPLVLISCLGFWALSALPVAWLQPVLVLMVLNASGSVGDLLVAVLLLRQPPGCLALDEGERVTLFIPGEA